jgi:hypothetical protein
MRHYELTAVVEVLQPIAIGCLTQHKRFYEKVIKVKADVAALLMFDLRHIST